MGVHNPNIIRTHHLSGVTMPLSQAENPRFLSAMMMIQHRDEGAFSPQQITEIIMAALDRLPIQFLSGVTFVIYKAAEARHKQEREQES
jgi:hypothetical protein